MGNLGAADLVGLDILRAEFAASAKIGVHGALTVRCDKDHRAGGRRLGFQRLGIECDALRTDVADVDFAEPIAGHLAEESGTSAKLRHAHGRVAGAAAPQDFGRRAW